MKLRLRSRFYMGFTALFYTLVGVAFTSGALRLSDSEYTPHIFWSCAFVFAGLLSAAGWVSGSYRVARSALTVCAAVSSGFALNFVAHLVTSDLDFLLGSAVWSYMAYSHYLVSRLPDPYLHALLDRETLLLRKMTGGQRGGK